MHLIAHLSLNKEKKVGAQGFEPRLTGIFCFSHHARMFERTTGRLSSWSSTISHPPVVIPVQLEPTVLPDYTILP